MSKLSSLLAERERLRARDGRGGALRSGLDDIERRLNEISAEELEAAIRAGGVVRVTIDSPYDPAFDLEHEIDLAAEARALLASRGAMQRAPWVTEVQWRRVADDIAQYAADVKGRAWRLRAGEPPAEPLWTLFIDGDRVTAFDTYWPRCWSGQHPRDRSELTTASRRILEAEWRRAVGDRSPASGCPCSAKREILTYGGRASVLLCAQCGAWFLAEQDEDEIIVNRVSLDTAAGFLESTEPPLYGLHGQSFTWPERHGAIWIVPPLGTDRASRYAATQPLQPPARHELRPRLAAGQARHVLSRFLRRLRPDLAVDGLLSLELPERSKVQWTATNASVVFEQSVAASGDPFPAIFDEPAPHLEVQLLLPDATLTLTGGNVLDTYQFECAPERLAALETAFEEALRADADRADALR